MNNPVIEYTCPTCGRSQHPGEKCQPGHADFDAEYQAFQGWVNNMSPDLAHVLFNAPICSVHEVPVDQCGCP